MFGISPQAVHGAGQIVHQDVPADSGLLAQQPGAGKLAPEAVVAGHVLPRMGLPGVHENPRGLGMPDRRGIEQRTLRRAVRSSERAELHHQRPGLPQLRQPDLRAVTEPQ
jgi:hypothetical protein